MEFVATNGIFDLDSCAIEVGDFNFFKPDNFIWKTEEVGIVRPVTPVPVGLTEILRRLEPLFLVGCGELLRYSARSFPENLLLTKHFVSLQMYVI